MGVWKVQHLQGKLETQKRGAVGVQRHLQTKFPLFPRRSFFFSFFFFFFTILYSITVVSIFPICPPPPNPPLAPTVNPHTVVHSFSIKAFNGFDMAHSHLAVSSLYSKSTDLNFNLN